jgi:hypothetical protein
VSLPQGGFGGRERSGRRRAVAVAAAVLVLAAGWGYLVVSWGEEERATATPEQTSSSEDARRQARAVPDEPAYATTPEEQTPSEARAEAPPPEAHGHPEGAAHEPGSYDPLGTGASPGDLSEIDRERIRFAASEFVSAAYGYSGEDPDEYNQGVGETVVWPAFYSSAGAGEISRYARQVEETGTRSAARLTRFEVEKTAPGSAAGYAYFETGEGHDPRTGKLTGERLAYRQEMTLSRSGASWKVKAVGKVEEV